MAILGRSALLYRKESPADLTVSPPAGQTAEAETSAYRCEPSDKVRITYTYTSNTNITSLKAQFRWYDKTGAVISTDEISLPTNSTGTRTDERTAPANTYTMRFRIVATSSESAAGTASFTSITIRLQIGMAKSVSVSVDADLIKEYVLGSDKPVVLESGNKTFSVSVERLVVGSFYGEQVLAGTPITIIIAPDGWGTGKPLVTLDSVTFSSWEEAISQDGVIIESVDGEGKNITVETQ